MTVLQRLGLPGTIGLCLVLIFALASILGPIVAPYAVQGLGTPNIAAKFQPLFATCWLGTDHRGRDMLSRVVCGARVSMTTGVLIVAASVLVGLPVGVLAGYFGG